MRAWIRHLTFLPEARGRTWTITARIAGDHHELGAPVTATGRSVELPSWQTSLQGDNETVSIEVRVVATALDADGRTDEAVARLVLVPPFVRETWTAMCSHFNAVIDIFPSATRFRPGQPEVAYVCRNGPDGELCTTVSGGRLRIHMEVDPVVPNPARPQLPRPTFTRQVRPIVNPAAGPTSTYSAHGRSINPAVIPLLDRPDRHRCARIEFTRLWLTGPLRQLRPDAIEWRAQPLEGGSVRFLDSPRGLRVLAYGVEEGEVRLEAVMGGQVLAQYRALVMRPIKVPIRVNILTGRDLSGVAEQMFPHFYRDVAPRTPPSDVVRAVALANALFRQMGIELVFDRDGATSHTAEPVDGFDGIFRVHSLASHTVRVDAREATSSASLNVKRRVLNIQWISAFTGSTTGVAAFIPSPAQEVVEDRGTPSASWVVESGAASSPLRMNLVPREGPHEDLWVCLVAESDDVGAQLQASLVRFDLNEIGTTMAHEIGHVLGLRHRHTRGDDDGVAFPRMENVMCYGDWRLRRDFDILQAKAVWQSPIVTYWRGRQGELEDRTPR